MTTVKFMGHATRCEFLQQVAHCPVAHCPVPTQYHWANGPQLKLNDRVFARQHNSTEGKIRTCRMSSVQDYKFETFGDFSSEKICEDKREVAKYIVDCLINNLCESGSGEGEHPFRTE